MKKRFGPSVIGSFRAELLAWFDLHKRDLPWRRSRDPYAIWVSEIMLQQTRVAAVLDHYAKWMVRFPTVEALAAASEDEVLTAWSGLGYYRRARFLHKGAKVVVSDFAGKLPETAGELRQLPGIGAYTSAATASIAFGEAVAVVDGNVERVLLRQIGAAETNSAPKGNIKGHSTLNATEMQEFATQLIDPQRPGDFNQAMMELGATVCLPRNPLCLQCPVFASCLTRGEHPTAERKPSVSVEIAYALIQRNRRGAEEVLLEQRMQEATVMRGMWELPLLQEAAHRADMHSRNPPMVLRHSIMQTNYRVAVIAMPWKPSNLKSGEAVRKWVKFADLGRLPLTGLSRKIFIRLGMLTHPL